MVLKITGRKKSGAGIIGLPSGNIFALHHCHSVKNSPGILYGRAGNSFRTGGPLAARPGPGIITGENTGGNGSWRRSNDGEPCQRQLFLGGESVQQDGRSYILQNFFHSHASAGYRYSDGDLYALSVSAFTEKSSYTLIFYGLSGKQNATLLTA